MLLRSLFGAAAAALASAQAVQPHLVVEILIAPTVFLQPILVQTFITENTVLVLGPGASITVENAPTLLNTPVTATSLLIGTSTQTVTVAPSGSFQGLSVTTSFRAPVSSISATSTFVASTSYFTSQNGFPASSSTPTSSFLVTSSFPSTETTNGASESLGSSSLSEYVSSSLLPTFSSTTFEQTNSVSEAFSTPSFSELLTEYSSLSLSALTNPLTQSTQLSDQLSIQESSLQSSQQSSRATVQLSSTTLNPSLSESSGQSISQGISGTVTTGTGSIAIGSLSSTGSMQISFEQSFSPSIMGLSTLIQPSNSETTHSTSSTLLPRSTLEPVSPGFPGSLVNSIIYSETSTFSLSEAFSFSTLSASTLTTTISQSSESPLEQTSSAYSGVSQSSVVHSEASGLIPSSGTFAFSTILPSISSSFVSLPSESTFEQATTSSIESSQPVPSSLSESPSSLSLQDIFSSTIESGSIQTTESSIAFSGSFQSAVFLPSAFTSSLDLRASEPITSAEISTLTPLESPLESPSSPYSLSSTNDLATAIHQPTYSSILPYPPSITSSAEGTSFMTPGILSESSSTTYDTSASLSSQLSALITSTAPAAVDSSSLFEEYTTQYEITESSSPSTVPEYISSTPRLSIGFPSALSVPTLLEQLSSSFFEQPTLSESVIVSSPFFPSSINGESSTTSSQASSLDQSYTPTTQIVESSTSFQAAESFPSILESLRSFSQIHTSTSSSYPIPSLPLFPTFSQFPGFPDTAIEYTSTPISGVAEEPSAPFSSLMAPSDLQSSLTYEESTYKTKLPSFALTSSASQPTLDLSGTLDIPSAFVTTSLPLLPTSLEESSLSFSVSPETALIPPGLSSETLSSAYISSYTEVSSSSYGTLGYPTSPSDQLSFTQEPAMSEGITWSEPGFETISSLSSLVLAPPETFLPVQTDVSSLQARSISSSIYPILSMSELPLPTSISLSLASALTELFGASSEYLDSSIFDTTLEGSLEPSVQVSTATFESSFPSTVAVSISYNSQNSLELTSISELSDTLSFPPTSTYGFGTSPTFAEESYSYYSFSTVTAEATSFYEITSPTQELLPSFTESQSSLTPPSSPSPELLSKVADTSYIDSSLSAISTEATSSFEFVSTSGLQLSLISVGLSILPGPELSTTTESSSSSGFSLFVLTTETTAASEPFSNSDSFSLYVTSNPSNSPSAQSLSTLTEYSLLESSLAALVTEVTSLSELFSTSVLYAPSVTSSPSFTPSSSEFSESMLPSTLEESSDGFSSTFALPSYMASLRDTTTSSSVDMFRTETLAAPPTSTAFLESPVISTLITSILYSSSFGIESSSEYISLEISEESTSTLYQISMSSFLSETLYSISETAVSLPYSESSLERASTTFPPTVPTALIEYSTIQSPSSPSLPSDLSSANVYTTPPSSSEFIISSAYSYAESSTEPAFSTLEESTSDYQTAPTLSGSDYETLLGPTVTTSHSAITTSEQSQQLSTTTSTGFDFSTQASIHSSSASPPESYSASESLFSSVSDPTL